MKLPAHDFHQVQSGVRLAANQHGDVIEVQFYAQRFLHGRGFGLVRGLCQHGCKTKHIALDRFVQQYDLIVLINGRDLDRTGQHDERTVTWIALLVYPLARRKLA